MMIIGVQNKLRIIFGTIDICRLKILSSYAVISIILLFVLSSRNKKRKDSNINVHKVTLPPPFCPSQLPHALDLIYNIYFRLKFG